MPKLTYKKRALDGSWQAPTFEGTDITSRLRTDLRTLGPWVVEGDRYHGYTITHVPSGCRAAHASLVRIAIARLHAVPIDMVRKAIATVDARLTKPKRATKPRAPRAPRVKAPARTIHGIAESRILAAIEADESLGFCLACKADAEGVEPDAEFYTCRVCDAPRVVGCEYFVHML